MKKQEENLLNDHKKLKNKGFKIHLEKNKNKGIQYYIGIGFIILGSTSLLNDISNVMRWFAVIGFIYIVSPKLVERYNYHLFTQEGILKPRFFNFAEPKFLAYKDIKFIDYVAGDYVFKNADIEFRFPKELLNEEEIAFLEEQMKILDQNTKQA